MNPVLAALLGVAVALQLVGAVSALLAREAVVKLHAVGVVSVLATLPLVAAVAAAGPSRTHAVKVVVTGLVVAVSSPFLSRATARAIRIRRSGELAATAEELDAGRRTR